MNSENPYAAPAATYSHDSVQTALTPQVRRPLALGLLAASTVLAVTWACVNQFVLARSLGPIPMFFIAMAIALFSSYATKDLVFAPLSCCLPILSAGVVVGRLRGWWTVHYDHLFLVAIGCSIPSLILVVVLRRGDRTLERRF